MSNQVLCPFLGAKTLILDQTSASCFLRGGFDLLFNQAEPREKAFGFATSMQSSKGFVTVLFHKLPPKVVGFCFSESFQLTHPNWTVLIKLSPVFVSNLWTTNVSEIHAQTNKKYCLCQTLGTSCRRLFPLKFSQPRNRLWIHHSYVFGTLMRADR